MAQAPDASIASSLAFMKASDVGPRKPAEDKRSGPYGRGKRGVWRSGLATAEPGTSAGRGRDASEPPYNWATIAASLLQSQTIFRPLHPRAGTGGNQESTLRAVSQSPRRWINVDRMHASPIETAEPAQAELIVDTTEQRGT